MTFRDLIIVSLGNLTRMKLRTFLTVSGVLIAIAAFVSMLSFGAGNQAYVSKQFDELGLFNTMQVYPKSKSDTAAANGKNLDYAAIERLAQLPGVNLAYPYDAFSVSARMGDSIVDVKAQALPAGAIKTKLFSQLRAGVSFSGDTTSQAMLSESFLKKIGIADPDSALGKQLIISMKISTIDSGLGYVIKGLRERGRALFDTIDFDSLLIAKYRNRLIQTEVNGVARQFMNGFLNARETISDTLTICGILSQKRMGRIKIESIVVPTKTALRFNSAGFSSDPTQLFQAMSSGTIFAAAGDSAGRSFPEVTLDLDAHMPYKPIKDSVEAMGFRAFSFAEQFDQIRKMFVYFDMALALIGLIALTTASLGIVNTMVMSILERKKEIGVLKSLGADDNDIRLLFLVESGVIGEIGAIAGIILGWLISRAASGVAQYYMIKEGVPAAELFALPPWLILIALSIGIVVSVLAGLYPAARAAHVDPVEALRAE
ncbi:conserved membrane hypothetical protein [Candidatus Zixiibacteriota bacterium]|nr:conserved membrane hypothetical protein [candidate division Zixibacteria bacterium]